MSAALTPQLRADVHPTSPLANVLGACARELEHIRVSGLRIEAAICCIAVQGELDSHIIGELQHLDAVIQHVAALRDFTAALALGVSPGDAGIVEEALSRITLADVRRRLAGDIDDDDDNQWEML